MPAKPSVCADDIFLDDSGESLDSSVLHSTLSESASDTEFTASTSSETHSPPAVLRMSTRLVRQPVWLNSYVYTLHSNTTTANAAQFIDQHVHAQFNRFLASLTKT